MLVVYVQRGRSPASKGGNIALEHITDSSNSAKSLKHRKTACKSADTHVEG